VSLVFAGTDYRILCMRSLPCRTRCVYCFMQHPGCVIVADTKLLSVDRFQVDLLCTARNALTSLMAAFGTIPCQSRSENSGYRMRWQRSKRKIDLDGLHEGKGGGYIDRIGLAKRLFFQASGLRWSKESPGGSLSLALGIYGRISHCCREAIRSC